METHKKKVESEFSALSHNYDRWYQTPLGRYIDESERSAILELLKPYKGEMILDVGTGTGIYLLEAVRFGAHVIGIDISVNMLNVLGKKIKNKKIYPQVDLLVADAENLPFDDATFDLVTCRLALHHFPQPNRALQEFARVLKTPGGLGFTDNVTVDDWDAAKYYNDFEKLRDPSHQNVVSMPRLCQMIEASGFQIRYTKVFAKEFEFHDWTNRQHVQPQIKTCLLQMMREIPEVLQPLFKPRWTDSTLFFSLREAVIVAFKS